MDKKIILIALSIFAFSLIGPTFSECQLANSPWPKFRHDLRNTGQSPYFGPQKDTLAWCFDAKAWIWSSPAIGNDGTIYFGTTRRDSGFFAINPDGTLKWHTRTEGAVVSSPALDTNGTIYIGVRREPPHTIYAFNPDGSIKWKKDWGLDIKSSPCIGPDGKIYFGSADRRFYVLRSENGDTLWRSPETIRYFTYSSPAIDFSGKVYIGCWDGNIYVLNPADWTWKIFYETRGNIASSPAIGDDGTIYINVSQHDSRCELYAINPDNTIKWIFPLNSFYISADESPVASPAIAADGTIYIGSNNGKLYAVNPDGTLKWTYTTGGPIKSSPAIGADGKIYFGSDDHFIYCLKPDSTLKWSYQTGGAVKSSPAIGKDGKLYVGSNDGKLYVFWGCNRGPKHDPTADSLNLDNDAGYWGIYCEKTPEWIMENVSAPSRDGTALLCGITGGDMSYSNVHCYRNFPAQADKDSFYLSLYFWFDKTTFNDNNSIIQALEFTMNKWQDGKRYEWALQWQNVHDSLSIANGDTLPQWRYWDPNQKDKERWVSLPIQDRLTGDSWHFLEMIGKIDVTDSTVQYLEFTIDSIRHPINIKVKPALTPGEVDRLAIAFQLDGTEPMFPYNVYVDEVNFHRLTTSVKSPLHTHFRLVENYSLAQNYPNPFNPSTTITFSLPKESKVSLQIFNIKGELVCTLEQRKLPPGNHSATWNGQDSQGNQCPSGIYLCQLKAGDFSSAKKLMLIK